MRSTWEETWLEVAFAIAKRSSCTNRQVGCVIVDTTNRPVATGYNGPPAGYAVDFDESCASYCPRANSNQRGSGYENCVSVHAEVNALLFADRRDVVGGTMYVTNPCCFACAKVIANSGITKVVAVQSDRDSHADVETPVDFLASCGITVSIINRKEES